MTTATIKTVVGNIPSPSNWASNNEMYQTVGYWGIFVDHLNKDQDKAVDERLQDMRNESIDKFMESAIGIKPREKTWINLV